MSITFNYSTTDAGVSMIGTVIHRDNLSAFDYYHKLISQHYNQVILYEETIVLTAWYAHGKSVDII